MEVARLDILIRSGEAVAATGNVNTALEKLGGTARRVVPSVSGAFDKLKNSLFSVKGLVVGLAGGLGVGKLIEYSSAWEDITSRVRLAADESERVGSVMQRLQEIADRNYSSFESVAETYLRNATTLNALGISTQRQINLTEAVANAMTISGAKGQRADVVMQAFARSMAAGALKGDDLNTVIQQGGRLAEALAVGMGKPVTALRDLGKEGKLTADAMEKALGSQLVKLKEEAESMPATIGDAFTRMRNQIMATVGSLAKDSGINTFFVGIIDKVTVAIREFTPTLLNLTRAITGTLDPTDELSDELKGATSAFVVMFGIVEAGVKLLGAVAMPMWKALKASVGSIVTVVVAAGQAWSDVMKGMVTAVVAFVKAAVTNLQSVGKVINGVVTMDFAKIKEGFAEAASASSSAFTTASGAIKASMDSARNHQQTVMGVLRDNSADYFAAVGEGAKDAFTVLTETASKTKAKLDELWDPSKRKVQDRTPEMGQGNIAKPPPKPPTDPAAAKAAAEALKELKDALGQLRGQYDGVWAAQQELEEGLKTLTKAQGAGLITAEERVKVEGQMRKALEDQLDPMGALNRDLDEQISLLKMSADEREVENQLISAKNSLTRDGLVLTDLDLEQMRERLKLLQEQNKLSSESDRLMKGSAKGRKDKDQTSIDAMAGLLGNKKSGYTEKDATNELQSMFGISIGDFQTESEMRIAALEEYYAAVQQLRDKDLVSAEVVAEAEKELTKAKFEYQKNAVMGGLGQIAKLMGSHNKQAFKIGQAAAIAQVAIDTPTAAMAAFKSMQGIPYVGPVLGAAAAAAAVVYGMQQISQIRSQTPPQFRTGGELIVGGTGGPDSQFVGMNVTPGERISINTPAQAVAAEKLVRLMESGQGFGGESVQQSITVVQTGKPNNKTPEQNARAMRRGAQSLMRKRQRRV